MLKLDLSEAAEADIAEVIAYYGLVSPVVRQSFEDSLEAALSLLCAMPFIGSKRFAHLFPRVVASCLCIR